jgi:hypothetical protein
MDILYQDSVSTTYADQELVLLDHDPKYIVGS